MMKMKTVMIAALVAAQLPAAALPAQAAELPPEEAAAPQTQVDTGVERNLGESRTTALGVGAAPAPLHAAAADEAEKPTKKRKSTGDKVLTGAAVVLGIGALAVGGLLVAIFVG